MAQDVTVGEKEKVRASKEALAERLGRDRFDVWFGSRVEWNLDNGCLTLKFQDDFTRDWCYRRFHGEVSAAVQSCGFPGLKVSFDVQLNRCTSTVVSTDTKRQTRVQPTAALEKRPAIESEIRVAKQAEGEFAVRTKEQEVEEEQTVVAFSNKDNKRSAESVAPISKQRVSTWENFVTGACNKMATATAEMILQAPGVVTPLLVYGPCGSGKTHLVQALANRLRKVHGSRRVIYLSSEQFTNDFMEAIRGSGLPSFRRKYRDVECLILDDIQFLAGKRATLQELKHTLDTLLRQGRQVIMVADRSLQELSILGPDVQARLTGGMVCPLDGLDDMTRKTLLTRLLAEAQIKISPKVIRELADKSSGDARVLFGLVNRLRALSLMLRGSFNDHQALEATQDLLTSCQPSVRLADIERAVCDVFGLEPKSLQAKGKTKTVSQPRMLAMFLARKYTRAAYAEIGDYFGHRRHSTVISAEKKVAEWLNDGDQSSSLDSTKIREALRNVEANLRVG